jgi:hypothetical protein
MVEEVITIAFLPHIQEGPSGGYAHLTESITEITVLLGSLTSNNEFRSIGGRFFGLLILAKGNDRCLVDKMNNALHGSTGDKVMVEDGILVGSSTHKSTSRNRLVRR